MRRALTLALLLAAADAGLRIGKPSGAGALKMATREEEKKAKEERRAKRKAAMSKDPEQARKELKERLAGYSTGEARARKYMQIARTKKFGMSDEEFAKQQQTYGRVAMDEAQMEMRRRAEKARDAVETQRIKENRSRVFRRVTGRAAKATDPVDADPTLAPVAVAADGSVTAAPRSTKLSPAAKKVLKGSALAAAAAAVGKLVVAKMPSGRRPAGRRRRRRPPSRTPRTPRAGRPGRGGRRAGRRRRRGDAADDGAAPVPGMSPEAAARLAEASCAGAPAASRASASARGTAPAERAEEDRRRARDARGLRGARGRQGGGGGVRRQASPPHRRRRLRADSGLLAWGPADPALQMAIGRALDALCRYGARTSGRPLGETQARVLRC